MVMKIQKIMGIGMLIISAIVIAISIKIGEGDVTFALISIPMGLWLLFSRKKLLDLNENDDEF